MTEEIEKISFTERVFLEVLVGEKIMVNGAKETIYDVQFEPKTRQLLIEFTSGLAVTAHKDDEFKFVRDVKRPRIRPNGGRLR
jgi:hypothetical protein